MDDSRSAASRSLGATLVLLPPLPAVTVAVTPSGNTIRSMRRSPSMLLVVSAIECLLPPQGLEGGGLAVWRGRRQHRGGSANLAVCVEAEGNRAILILIRL